MVTDVRVTLCTKARPWNRKPLPDEQRVQHPDARKLHAVCECCQRYHCPHCGYVWRERLSE